MLRRESRVFRRALDVKAAGLVAGGGFKDESVHVKYTEDTYSPGPYTYIEKYAVVFLPSSVKASMRLGRISIGWPCLFLPEPLEPWTEPPRCELVLLAPEASFPY